MELNLAALRSVRAFVTNFNAKNLPLHVLVNNAGVVRIFIHFYYSLICNRHNVWSKLEDRGWLRKTVWYKSFGPFLIDLTIITSIGEDQRKDSWYECSVILYSLILGSVVSSAAHVYGSMDLDNLNAEKFYTPYYSYMLSKLANVYVD